MKKEFSFSKTFNKNLLKGKTILITGATSGIGEKTSFLLNELGANLILIGRNDEKLKALKNKMGESNLYIKLDLSKEDSIFQAIKNLPNEFLPLNGAFHSSGNELIKSLSITKTKDLYKSISNSSAVALSISRAASNSRLFKNNSSIIFMSSVSSILGTSGMTAYAASKGCIDSMVKSVAIEVAPRNVRVNSIIAGAVISPMHEKLTEKMSTDSIKKYEIKHPLGFGSCEDIANLVVFLISDASKWITGTSIVIDGGFSAY
ncbi:SDR family oxidoreductase [Prochlorococcus sp. AH-716-B04]|nr:SDR family oxidoreductase [Prochlorococcus sp. AH-716-B04]